MKKNKIGFTLPELMVIVTITAILAISGSKFFSKSLSDNDKLTIYTNELKSNIETIRNNSLFGKGVLSGTNIVNIKQNIISIEINKNSIFKYNDINNNIGVNSSINSSSSFGKGSIKSIKCYTLDSSSNEVKTNIDIVYTGNSVFFSGCTSPNDKILEINTTLGGFNKYISINSINGLIKVK